MTTIERSLINEIALLNSGLINSSNKHNAKTIRKVTKVVSRPFILYNQLIKLRELYYLKQDVKKTYRGYDKLFYTVGLDEKVEVYSQVYQITEMINECIESVDLSKPKNSSYISKLSNKLLLKIIAFINKKENEYYKLTYPEKPDINDPNFIKQVLEAHGEADISCK